MSREQGIQLYNQGNAEEAMKQFLLEDIDPSDDAELAYYLGLCHTKLGEFETALHYFQRVLEIDFHILRTFQTRMIASFIFNQTEEFSLAIHHLEQLLEEGFESPQIYASLGYSYWCMGDVDRALEVYEKALEMDPEHQTTLNSLGYILAEKGMRISDALEFCQKALSKDPINPNYLDSLGWAYYKSGKKEEALHYLTKACESKNADSLIRNHLQKVQQS